MQVLGVQDHAAMSPDWHALYTRHQHEKAVASILKGKGFDVFLPLYSAVHRWQDRAKELSLPLFPCYVFVRGGLDRRADVLATPGVHSFVPRQGPAADVPEAEIEAVRRLVVRSNGVEPHPYLRCGEWVRVKSGPLEGLEGILTRKKNLFRLVLSVELLEKSVAVEVSASMVERAARRHPRVTMARDASLDALAFA